MEPVLQIFPFLEKNNEKRHLFLEDAFGRLYFFIFAFMGNHL